MFLLRKVQVVLTQVLCLLPSVAVAANDEAAEELAEIVESPLFWIGIVLAIAAVLYHFFGPKDKSDASLKKGN